MITITVPTWFVVFFMVWLFVDIGLTIASIWVRREILKMQKRWGGP